MWVGKLFGLVFGGGLPEQLRRAYEAKLQAANDSDRIAAERDFERISAAIEMARIAAQDRLGATSIGRYLIVIPYGLWWAAIFLVQILNPWFGMNLVVIDVPPMIHDMAKVLIPAILIADVGQTVARRR